MSFGRVGGDCPHLVRPMHVIIFWLVYLLAGSGCGIVHVWHVSAISSYCNVFLGLIDARHVSVGSVLLIFCIYCTFHVVVCLGFVCVCVCIVLL